MNASGSDEIASAMLAMGRASREAARVLALASTRRKNDALAAMARAIREDAGAIGADNAGDVAAARDKGLKASFLDRLTLTLERIEEMARGLEEIAALDDPVGAVMAEWTRPNGLKISRVRVPIGVVGIVYESRPNVTADAGGLCIKSGNATLLRGGSDGLRSSIAIAAALQRGLRDAGLPETAIQTVPMADRRAVGLMLEGLGGTIDAIVPRGGKSLVARVRNEARVPVFSHLEGICHVYIDKDADPAVAVAVAVNSKMRRTGVCGAAETVLIDRRSGLAQDVVGALIDSGCAVRGDAEIAALDPRVTAASEEDWSTEYLEAIVSARAVSGVDEAIRHIARHGSQHTDSIVTRDVRTAERFLTEVDSAIVLHNASTQFADGGEFGFGAEIGIATGKLHARGPVGVEQLTTFKYQVRGTGQTRP